MQASLREALREMIDRISESVRPGQVVPAFLAGGAGTYLHLQKVGGPAAEQARYSEDADIHFGRALVFDRNLVVAYTDSDGQERMLALDGSYTIDIGLRHPECLDEAQFLFSSTNGRIKLYLLSPLDLAVIKAGRYQDHDRADLELLARAGLLDADAFRIRAVEALDYLATDPALIGIKIDEAIETIRSAAPR